MASIFSCPAAVRRALVQSSPNSCLSLPIFTLKEALSDFHTPQPPPVTGRGLGPKHGARGTEATPFLAPGPADRVLSNHRNARKHSLPSPAWVLIHLIHSDSCWSPHPPPYPMSGATRKCRTEEWKRVEERKLTLFPPEQYACERYRMVLKCISLSPHEKRKVWLPLCRWIRRHEPFPIPRPSCLLPNFSLKILK